MRKKVDLNCDLGESFGMYKIGNDEQIIPLITSANIACGFHASDPVVMTDTIKLAKINNTSIGAHPGFPDLQGFGRRNMYLTFDEIKTSVQYQISALQGMAHAKGLKLQHVKPHGALYNMAAEDELIAQAICEAVIEIDKNLILLGLSGSLLIKKAKNLGLKTAEEVFADRAYNPNGSLVSRNHPEALINDEEHAAKRVFRMIKEGKVLSITGDDIPIQADSICVHGDGENALKMVETIRKYLIKNDILIAPLEEVIKLK